MKDILSMPTAVTYLRFSTEMQNETSIEMQRAEIEKFAEKEGIKIIDEYVDRAKSGTTDKRKGLENMMADIENGEIKPDFLIIYKIDRFFRNEELYWRYKLRLIDANVSINSATEDINGSSSYCKIIEAILVINAEDEIKKISENVKNSKITVAEKGIWCGGTPPLGYDVDENTGMLIINKEEAKVVKYAFELREKGFSYDYIIGKLNEKNYKTKPGNSFGKNSLFEIYRNIKYKGIYEYNRAASKSKNGKFNRHASKNEDEIVRKKGLCPQIVSDEVWDKVNAMGRKNGGIKPKGNYLLSGLVTCKCNTIMQVNRRNNKKNHKEYISFACPKHKNKEGCNAKEINLEILEEFVLHELAKKIFETDVIDNFLKAYPQIDENNNKARRKEIKDLELRIKHNKQKIDNCIKRIEDGCGDNTAEALDSRINKLTEENKDIKQELEVLKRKNADIPCADDIRRLKSTFVAYMRDEDNLPFVKSVLQVLIEKITVTNEDVEIVFNL